VAEALPLSESELRLLESLARHRVRFMVVDLSAAALQGAPVVTEDVDLWFENLNDPRLIPALNAVGAAYIPPMGFNPPMLGGPGSDPFDVVIRMDGLETFADEFKHARTIHVGKQRLKVLSLERILASKTAANRPKDKLVIPMLQNALRTLQVKQARKPNARSAKPRVAKRKPSPMNRPQRE
jgi:hypothetical protein